MPARRLPPATGSGPERARVQFTFDGHSYEGVEGEPLAVSLLAAGRRTLSRSFRFHRPRGLMCSTGQCGWCECEVDGRPSVRACRVPLRDGMVVRGEHAWPSVEHDLLRVLDLGSRFVPPTFYHHRFLRPRRLRKAYLDVIRSFGGRGRLGRGVPFAGHPRTLRRDEPDVLVVGGGRAGLLAAIAAAQAGARVVLVEAEAVVGETDLLAEARAAGVDIRPGTTATGWYGGLVTAIDDTAIWELRARAVVAATGSYELVPSVPGSDRPGVMGARLVARLVVRDGVLPGVRALLVGTGEELAAAGAALAQSGATVVGPIGTDTLRAIGGRGPVAWAWFADGVGSARRERVDLLVFGDRTPNLDLVLAAGGRVAWADGRLVPQTEPDGRTSVAGLYVAGDAADRSASTDVAASHAQARSAGRAAGEFALGSTGALGQLGRLGVLGVLGESAPATNRAGDPTRSSVADGRRPAHGADHAVLCFCEDVRGWEIQAERAAGYVDPELVKRRTGALTGPCQGKYCLSAVTCAVSAGADPAIVGVVLPTGRPPLRPVRLADLVATDPPTFDAVDSPFIRGQP